MVAVFWCGLVASVSVGVGIVILLVKVMSELDAVEEHLVREQKPTKIKIKQD